MRTLSLITVLLLSALGSAQGIGGGLNVQDSATEIRERLGTMLPGNLKFTDDQGKRVQLQDYFTGKRPIILNIGYFGCPSLCGQVTNGMVDALKEVDRDKNLLDLVAGRDFTILSVSFDPTELNKPHLVQAKKENYVEHYGKAEAAAHWHFLVGDEKNTKALCKATGFGFRWNETSKAYDHRAALIFLSPDGKITRYLSGAYYFPRTFRLAVVEASEGKVGTTIERFVLSCYGYDPTQGTYSRIGSTVMTIGGGITLLALATMLFFLFRRERTDRKEPAPVTP